MLTVCGPTRSMAPTIVPGDRIAVRVVGIAEVRVGEIVVFRDVASPAGLTTHRVIEVHAGWIWTKGDANPRMDAILVTARNLVGVVVKVN